MRSKDELRTHLKTCRQAFVDERMSLDLQLPSGVAEQLACALSRRGSLAGYAALRGEPDVFPLLAGLVGRITGLPWMDESDERMRFRAWRQEDPLERSPFGFRQPPADAPLLIPDVILVPVIGFDRAFNRLGHGKGHYDRALIALPRALKIGVAWSVQETETIPSDPWDVRLDAILTEREWRVRA